MKCSSYIRILLRQILFAIGLIALLVAASGTTSISQIELLEKHTEAYATHSEHSSSQNKIN